MSNTLDKVECILNILYTRLDILKGLVQSCEDTIIEERRKKWWLLNPDIACIKYVAMWETDYSHSDWITYPIISWRSITDINGTQTWNVDTISYPPLKSEITDEETVLVVKNPYATI